MATAHDKVEKNIGLMIILTIMPSSRSAGWYR